MRDAQKMKPKKTVAFRLDSELDRDLKEVVREESVDKSTAMRMLVSAGYREWRLKRALQQLREGRISVWQASDGMGMALWDFVALLKKEEGIEWVEFETNEILGSRQS
jgi:predicted HTH domain antitoxin